MADADKHILVVDDDPAMRDSLNQLLEAAGWHVTLSDCGKAALQSEALSKGGFVLTGVRIPGVSGLYLMRQIKKQYEAPPVHLI